MTTATYGQRTDCLVAKSAMIMNSNVTMDAERGAPIVFDFTSIIWCLNQFWSLGHKYCIVYIIPPMLMFRRIHCITYVSLLHRLRMSQRLICCHVRWS
jgi:hypothetical protein